MHVAYISDTEISNLKIYYLNIKKKVCDLSDSVIKFRLLGDTSNYFSEN